MRRLIHKRQWSAWILIGVFLPVLLMSSLHHHAVEKEPATVCYDCVHHVQHPGHITSSTHSFDSCVLCHFLLLPFVASSIVAIIIFATHFRRQSAALQPALALCPCGSPSLRAPPAL